MLSGLEARAIFETWKYYPVSINISDSNSKFDIFSAECLSSTWLDWHLIQVEHFGGGEGQIFFFSLVWFWSIYTKIETVTEEGKDKK